MAWIHRLCNKRTLSCLLVLNLVAIVLLLLGHDVIGRTRSSDRYKSAYERWKKMRDNWTNDNPNNVVMGLGFTNKEVNDNSTQLDNSGSDLRGLSLKEDDPLSFIPRVPKFSVSDIVPYLMENITRPFLQLPNIKYTDKVVILTPVCDVAGRFAFYSKLLTKLTYPHELISVYFGEDSSSDSTLDMAKVFADELQTKFGFRRAGAFHFNITGGLHGTWGDIHEQNGQHERRSHIAKSRNLLAKQGLQDEDWVLWIDSDISDLPPDLVQQLIYAKSHVTAALCLFKSGPYKRNYDKNTWRETPLSLEDQRHLPPDFLIVEGYSDSKRLFLPDLRAEGRIVPLDGVGGCALLVNATCHRQGLVFPERLYKNHIETEGLAKMAKDMGYSVVGMPFVEVFH